PRRKLGDVGQRGSFMKHILVAWALSSVILAGCGPKPSPMNTDTTQMVGNRATYERIYGRPVAAEQTACGVAHKYLASSSSLSRTPSFAGNSLAGLGYLLFVVPVSAISDAASAQYLFVLYGANDNVVAYRRDQPPRCLGSAPDPRDAIDPTTRSDVVSPVS